VCTNVHYGLSFVNSPDNFLEIIKGMRGSPSVESSGKISKKFRGKGLLRSVVFEEN
jgi:hypothetical protein